MDQVPTDKVFQILSGVQFRTKDMPPCGAP